MTDLRQKLDKVTKTCAKLGPLQFGRFPRIIRNCRKIVHSNIHSHDGKALPPFVHNQNLGMKNPDSVGSSHFRRIAKFSGIGEVEKLKNPQNSNHERIVRITYPNESKIFGKIQNHFSRTEKFISQDDSENCDNEDPGWDEIRKLSNLEDFRKYANSVFDKQIANPNICHSYHGFKRKRLDILYRRRKRFNMQEPTVELPKNCKEIMKRKNLDRPINPVIKRCKFGTIDFQAYVAQVCQALADHKLLKEYNWHGSGHSRRSNCGMVPGKELAERNWRYILRHFIHSMEETKSIYSSMCCDEIRIIGNGSTLKLSYLELEKVIDLEKLFGRFVRFYGPNEEINCKWCRFLEGRNVWHPY